MFAQLALGFAEISIDPAVNVQFIIIFVIRTISHYTQNFIQMLICEYAEKRYIKKDRRSFFLKDFKNYTGQLNSVFFWSKFE